MKVLVSDYDKTFYLNEEDIKRNKEAVRKFRENGNLFGIATGRSYLDLKAKIEKYNIEYDFIIINHGSTIIGDSGEILYNFAIDPDIILKLKKVLQIEENNVKYLNHKSEKKLTNIYFCCNKLDSRLDFSKNLTKVSIKYKNSIDVLPIIKNLKENFNNINTYLVSHNTIEIISKEINKSKAIALIARHYNLDKKFIYTVGDGYSDVDMVRDYNGYAMDDSVHELKQIALKTVDSVSNIIDDIM